MPVDPEQGQTADEVPSNDAAHSAPPAEDVGAVVAGRYKLLQQIGEGGMGSVFMAEQMRPVKRMVAFKVIKAGMDSKQVLARFESERQALALMDHPNIAKVLDAGTTERGHPYFVMELVKGVPLMQFCDDRQASVVDRLKIFQQICHAVQHAHQKGIIHRDLKPSNILVESHDGRAVSKVIDFGLAKAMNAMPLTDRSLFTNYGAVLGTPLYMAPEQAEFSAIDVDTRADVYALGVILYELLTGTTPVEKKRFAKAAWDEIRRVIKEEEPQTPSARLSANAGLASIAARRQMEPKKLGKLVRGDLDWIVMKALAKERDRRYETANAFAADVERFLNDEPVSAGPPTLGYKFRKFVHRNRARVTVAAVLLLALLAGVTVSTWQAIRATRAESNALDAQGKATTALTAAERSKQEADEQRRKAETQAASLAVDIDLKYCEDGEVPLGLLRLARTLPTIPEHAKELRECAALNILAWGQQICPVWTLEHNDFSANPAELSPDGLTVMTDGDDGTVRLLDSLTGKQRAVLVEPSPTRPGIPMPLQYIQFSDDGRTVLAVHTEEKNVDEWTIRLWDAASGQLQAETAKLSGNYLGAWLSDDGSRLTTARNAGDHKRNEVCFWDAKSGRLIRKLDFFGDDSANINVSPDGRSVLATSFGNMLFSDDGNALKPLLGPQDQSVYAMGFSPSGRSAVAASHTALRWWNVADWKPSGETAGMEKFGVNRESSLKMVHDNIAIVDASLPTLVFVRNLPEPIIRKSGTQVLGSPDRGVIASPDGGLVAFDTDEVYDTQTGKRLLLPPRRKFHSELRQFSEDGRFALFLSFIADLAVDKKIPFNADSHPEVGTAGYSAPDSHFLKNQNAWIGIRYDAFSGYKIAFLRKADASLDAELLGKWCEVVARGKLDESGRFSPFDEATWEKSRRELANLLDANPNAQVLRSAATDRLYWLRKEIEKSEPPHSVPDEHTAEMLAAILTLLNRLVAAEPKWPNYSWRAGVHSELNQWEEAARDQLEAARLAGERYWLRASPIYGYELGARLALPPGRPREQYELAQRWTEARIRAGVSEESSILADGRFNRPSTKLTNGLIQFRLGRYTDALATLRSNDISKLSQTAGMLMSPWNLPALIADGGYKAHRADRNDVQDRPSWMSEFTQFDPFDLTVRAMCHHHLGQPKEAAACLRIVHERWPKVDPETNPELHALLGEAETLIEGKPRP
jgi:WD40 repeat protein